MVARQQNGPLAADELNTLFQYALALSRQRDEAYDLLQGALEKYLIEIKCRRDPIASPIAYVRTLIRNRLIDTHRYNKRWNTEHYDEENSRHDVTPVDLEQFCIDAQSLESVWAQLSTLDRDILYQWAVLGYTTDEVCQRMDMPRGTFLSRIHRLRKKLQPWRDDDQLRERKP